MKGGRQRSEPENRGLRSGGSIGGGAAKEQGLTVSTGCAALSLSASRYRSTPR